MRVAICQDTIIPGGRLQVILGFVQALNQLGIRPDVLYAKARLDWARVGEIYPDQVELRPRPVSLPTRPQDLATMLFNQRLRRFEDRYDLLVNTSNSLSFLPPRARVASYVFYPRRARIEAPTWSIHLPDEPLPRLSVKGLYRTLLRGLERVSHLEAGHAVVAMTEFTRAALARSYPALPLELPILYPPVDFEAFRAPPGERLEQVVSLGRFTPDKRQLGQIELATRFPDLPFHLAGFATDRAYFARCQRAVAELGARNVTLHPDLPFAAMVALLGRSRYFVHSLVDEPFGLTAVQAIATGALPLVHDSGGQRETVPEAALRWRDFDEAASRLAALRAAGAEERGRLLAGLKAHVFERFSRARFLSRARELLAAWLEGAGTTEGGRCKDDFRP